MRNPRSTTFNLTSIQSQRGTSKSVRKFSPRSERTKALGALPDQENRLKNQVREYRIKNQTLSEFIQHFENSSTDLNERDNLIKDLQVVLIKHTSSLEKRMKKIDDIEKQVLIFRSVSNEDEEFDKLYPIKLPDESYRTHSARNNRRKADFLPPPKYQKPKRRIFPPPKIEKTQDLSKTNPLIPLNKKSNTSTNYDSNQIDLKKERDKLTQKTLYLDRLISIEKLKLKLCHDHRTLAELKNELDVLQNEGPDLQSFNQNTDEKNNDEYDINNIIEEEDYPDENDEDLESFKNSIELIKERIQDEKRRIAFYENQYYPIHSCAIDIQRVWRGYLVRKSQKEQKKSEIDDNKNNELQNTKQEEIENLNNKENLNEVLNNEEEINEVLNNEEEINEGLNNEKEMNEVLNNEEEINEGLNNEKEMNEALNNKEDLNEKVVTDQNMTEKVEIEEDLNETEEKV